MTFQNRKHAGDLLAAKLIKYKNKDAIVLALPRGGVPIGYEIAKQLDIPLDVLIVRKIGAPFNAELAAGAICENDEAVLNTLILSQIGLNPEDMNGTIRAEKAEVQRQINLFRQGRLLTDLSKKLVIIADDGLATGATVNAAIKYLKKKGVRQIVVAVPVAPSSSAQQIRLKVEELVTLAERDDLYSVSQWYQDFAQVSDKEVISLLKMIEEKKMDSDTRKVEIKISNIKLQGELATVPNMKAVIIFTHGSGSSHRSTRNLQVARVLNSAGFGTLLFDLISEDESRDRKNVFDIELLSQRLLAVTRWLYQQPQMESVTVGYFGASTGAAAALMAASKLSDKEAVYAIVSRGGRPDLAGKALSQVKVPTLLIVGGQDYGVIELNRKAQKLLAYAKMYVVADATHLFEEPGTLEEVASHATQWFNGCLTKNRTKAVHRQGTETHV